MDQNEKAANEEQLREIGQAEQNAVKEADVFLLILDGGNGSHTEFGMAIALENDICISCRKPAPNNVLSLARNKYF